jgi:hypothetical protein
LSSGGRSRTQEDTGGHAIKTVRDREDEGSNPSPPTIFVFKIGSFRGCLESADHSRVTISWGTIATRAALVTVVGGSELARQQSMAPRRLHADDATGRTVRHTVRKSQAGGPEDAQGRTVRHPRSRLQGLFVHPHLPSASALTGCCRAS